jgi:integrase/recombinase XerD
MTPLRQKLIDEIQLRGFSIHTQRAYERSVAGLAQFYHRSPDQIVDDEIKTYLLHLLRVRKLAVSSIIVAVSALRFFFGQILHRPTEAIEKALPTMKKPILRPRVYSVQELVQLFGPPDLNAKHRALLMTTYAAGLRVSEVCHLRIPDLLSDRYQIRVVQGKAKRTAIRCFRRGSRRSYAATGGSTIQRIGCFQAKSILSARLARMVPNTPSTRR